jgi:hypothetical protein
MPLYTFIHNLLNVLVQIGNEMGLQKKFRLVSEALDELTTSFMPFMIRSQVRKNIHDILTAINKDRLRFMVDFRGISS